MALLSDPHEFPEVSRKGIHVGIGKEVEISLSAETLIADENVKTMVPTRRKCLLTEEIDVPDMHTMQLFTDYKKSSCQLECKSVENISNHLSCFLPFFLTGPCHFCKSTIACRISCRSLLKNSSNNIYT